MQEKNEECVHICFRKVRKMERRRRRMKKPTTPDDRNHEPATSDPNAAMITERETEREGETERESELLLLLLLSL